MSNNQYPDGWTEMTFGEMAEQVSERVDDPKTAGVEVYVGLEHLDPEDLRIRRRGTPDDVEATKLRVRPGQIIFGKRRAYQRKVAVADFDGIASAHAMILQEKPALYPGFLPFFMQSDVFMDRAVTISEGGLSPTIKWKTLAAEKFLLPPPEQQRELVELMQGFERAIEAGEGVAEAFALVDEKLLLELLGNSQGVWQSKQLSEIAEVRLGRQRSPDKAKGERPVKYLRAANIREGYIDYDDVMEMDFSESEQATYELKAGDLLLVEGGEARDVGMCSKFDGASESLCMQNTVIRVRVLDREEVSPDFLFHAFKALKRGGVFARMSSGTKLKHLGSSKMAALQISLPDSLHQAEILGKLKASDNSRRAALGQVSSLRQLRFSILNTALSPSAVAEAAAEVPA